MGVGSKFFSSNEKNQGIQIGCPDLLWSGLRGSNPLPGIPRIAFRNSQEPCLTSNRNALRAWVSVSSSFRLTKKIRASKSDVLIYSGAGYEARTRYLHLGKVALYQMSYARRWCPEPESNQRHVDFQSTALPTELSGQIFRPAETARPGNFNPKRDPRDETPSRGRWRPGTGSNRRPLA